MTAKRILLWIAIVIGLLSLVACGSSEKPISGDPASGGEVAVGGDESGGLAGSETVQEEQGVGDAGQGPQLEGGTSESQPPEDKPTEEGTKGDSGELESLGGGYIYRREGGIAGFCDVVTILAGTATVASCATEPPEIIGEVTLTNDQSQTVNHWLEDLASFEYEQKDDAVADAMTILLTFEGQGPNEATADEMAEMEALALEVLQAVQSQ